MASQGVPSLSLRSYCNTDRGRIHLFMTQYFLYYVKKNDEYTINSIGTTREFIVVHRKDGQTDDQFKEEAISVFDKHVGLNNPAEFEMIKTAHTLL